MAAATQTYQDLRRGTVPEDEASHILIIDDDRRIRRLLQKYLTESGYRVTTAESAEKARAKMSGLSYDLLVLDIMMPGESGLDFARDLRKKQNVPILMLTALSEIEERINGLEAGADDYLSKPFEPRELLLRIHSILRRSRTGQPKLVELRLGDCVFIPSRGELKCKGEAVRLTTREREILRLFAASPGVPLSRSKLSEPDGSGRERSIDVLINRLRRKIEPDPTAPVYLQTVRGAGYALFTD
jgi:two-component system phosphate regulon response regulator OmpR